VRLGWPVLLLLWHDSEGKLFGSFFFFLGGEGDVVVPGEVVMGWNLAQEANQGSRGLGGMEWPCLAGWVIDTTLTTNAGSFIFWLR